MHLRYCLFWHDTVVPLFRYTLAKVHADLYNIINNDTRVMLFSNGLRLADLWMGVSVTLVHVSIDLNRLMSLRRPDCKESQGCWWVPSAYASNSATALAVWHGTEPPMHRSDASANPASLALVCCCLLTLVRLHPPIHSQLICLLRTAGTCNNSCSTIGSDSIDKDSIDKTMPCMHCWCHNRQAAAKHVTFHTHAHALPLNLCPCYIPCVATDAACQAAVKIGVQANHQTW